MTEISRRHASSGLWWAVVLFTLVGILALIVKSGTTDGWEASWLRAIRAFASPPVTGAMRFLTVVGGSGGLIGIWFVISFWWWKQARPRLIGWLAGALAGAAGLEYVLKHLVDRTRPIVVPYLAPHSGLSFPSGHATASLAFFGMLAILLAHRSRSLAKAPIYIASGLLVGLVGFSRIYLGVHWPTDVLGGYLLGGAWLAFLVCARLRL